MSYVPGCTADIFFSYAHVDNHTNWVGCLDSFVRRRVAELTGTTTLEVWRDLKLDGLDDFNETIRDLLNRTAVMIAVVTPRYVQSKSCRDELQWFSKRATLANIGHKSSLARVRKTPLPAGMQEPPELFATQTLGFAFFERDEPVNFIVEFDGGNETDPTYARFKTEAERLSQAIANVLVKMRDRLTTGDEPKTVFLAETSSKLAEIRERVRREIVARNHRVLPESSLWNGGAFDRDALMRQFSENPRAAIHIVGATYAAVPEGEQISFEETQYDVTAAKNLTQVVWLADVEHADERQKRFIERIRNTESRARRLEICEGSFSEFLESALDLLKEPPPPPPRDPEIGKSVYLIFHEDDAESDDVREIQSHLWEAGIPVEVSLFQASEADLQGIEESFITGNDATVILYGQGKDVWLRTKRAFVTKALGKAAGVGERERAIYLCPPKTAIKDAYYGILRGRTIPDGVGLPPVYILGDFERFSADKLAPLISRLRSRTQASIAPGTP